MSGPDPETDREFLIQSYSIMKELKGQIYNLDTKFEEFKINCKIQQDCQNEAMDNMNKRITYIEDRYKEFRGAWVYIGGLLLILVLLGRLNDIGIIDLSWLKP